MLSVVQVLDDVYQYHMPPVRRIPPLLWTRIRNDLPNYLSDCEADGVSVLNWYHRQFNEAARKRYFTNQNQAMYFYSMIADYFLGMWGGGVPKPFKYTEIQRHRFNLKSKEGLADRKVPAQPLVYYNKEGKITRYNLRKVLPCTLRNLILTQGGYGSFCVTVIISKSEALCLHLH
ncbi:NACHT domain- and WD repeat-containing protein 1 [Portunus trituberculatus]|uniref:NACHT domain-and WD repeat-containing protein 1 n=1 Tax=Portunus trituberculatus TaxID=210409 RepID=A0A5B7HFW1_PORTR|nr:NACHT domain- and WD repeat-containing protein 1 [Portunus trituberculatus]